MRLRRHLGQGKRLKERWERQIQQRWSGFRFKEGLQATDARVARWSHFPLQARV